MRDRARCRSRGIGRAPAPRSNRALERAVAGNQLIVRTRDRGVELRAPLFEETPRRALLAHQVEIEVGPDQFFRVGAGVAMISPAGSTIRLSDIDRPGRGARAYFQYRSSNVTSGFAAQTLSIDSNPFQNECISALVSARNSSSRPVPLTSRSMSQWPASL